MEPGAITARTVFTLLLATWPRRLVLGGLLLIPVLIAALGGFGQAEPRSFETQPGEQVDLGPLAVTPVAYFVSDETQRSSLDFVEGAEAWVGVIVQVENLTDSSISLAFPGPASEAVMPWLDADVLLSDVTVATLAVRVADGTSGDHALPGVPTEVALLWPVADAGAAPETLAVTMTESLWTFGPMSNENRWLALGDRWTAQLPRTELPPAMVDPEDKF